MGGFFFLPPLPGHVLFVFLFFFIFLHLFLTHVLVPKNKEYTAKWCYTCGLAGMEGVGVGGGGGRRSFRGLIRGRGGWRISEAARFQRDADV